MHVTSSISSETLKVLLFWLCCTISLSFVPACYSQSTSGSKKAAASSASSGSAVQFPNPETAFIIGPQIRSGGEPIASYFDEVAARRASYWAKELLRRDYLNSTPDGSDDLTVAQNHYDLALCLYIAHYRTGDPALLDYARRVADRWWESQFIGRGGPDVPGPSRPGPLYSGLAGLMLRALDGRPEMWSYIDAEARQMMNTWIIKQIQSQRLYSDLRDLGYIQLYAVLLAKVLPDRFQLFEKGSDKPATGQVTDGAAKRKRYLADAEQAAVEYFGKLQHADGGWRWQLWQADPTIPAGTAVEQPFMLGIYLESVVALHQLTQNEAVKSSLLNQLSRACKHLYEGAYLKTQAPGQRYKYRALQYWYPLELNRGQYYADRHLHTSTIHAFGYAYHITEDPKFKQWGDDLWDASFGRVSDGMRGLLDSTTHTKEFTMETRSASRYLAWRRGEDQASSETETAQPVPQGSSERLVSAALTSAVALAHSNIDKAEVESLLNQVEEVLRMFSSEKDRFQSPKEVLTELEAALTNTRNALALVTTATGSTEAASLRLEWTAARLKRAQKRMQLRIVDK